MSKGSIVDRWPTRALRAGMVAGVAALAIVACIDAAGLSDAKCVLVCAGVCVDPANDATNCGGCGTACASGQVCSAGNCTDVTTAQGCGAGTTACGEACIDTKVDPANCGACGKTCVAGQTCSGGACACPAAAPDLCAGGGEGGTAACVSFSSDPMRCGNCETSCALGTSCVAGACVAQTADAGGPLSMSVLAGQLGSFGNTNGTATDARFSGPWGICSDATNLYVADTNNCVLRKIVIATGVTTTFAGTTNACASFDGAGAAARFNGPTGCTSAGTGVIYVADRGGCAIRKVDLVTATVTTLAGGTCGYLDGTGSAARFNAPQALVYDGTANLYVSDTGNHSIRMVALASGEVTTIAGAAPPTALAGTLDDVGAAARFSGPHGLYHDVVNGALFVADYNNHTIRRIALANNAVTTVVGTAGLLGTTNATGTAARLRNPIGLAYDGIGSLYVAEDGNHDIRVVSLSDLAVTTNAGATGVAGYANGQGNASLFFNPRFVLFDGAGGYFVSDHSNHAIRKVVAANATVTTVAGLGAAFGSSNGAGATATFNFPWSIASDGADTIFVADHNTHTIRTVSLSTGVVGTLAGSANQVGNVDGAGVSARFNNPGGIAYDGNGNLYVADRSNHTIRKIVVATATVTTIAGSAGSAGYAEGTGAAILFNVPSPIAHDRGNPGKLYVGDNNRVIREIVLPAVTSTTIAGTAGANAVADGVGNAARFSNVTGIAAKGDGKVYIADTNRIRVVDLATQAVVTLSGTGGFGDGRGAFANFNFNAQPSQLTFDANGDLLLADYNNHVIRKFSPTTLQASTAAGIYGAWGGLPGPLPATITTNPRGVAPVPGGFVFAANYGLFVVR